MIGINVIPDDKTIYGIMTEMDDLMSASIRLDTTIETIKTDLIQLRNQDIKLMKQLIQIGETIQQITKRQIQQRPSFNDKGYLSQVLMFVHPSSISVRVDTPLIRRQSVPTYCQMKKYCGSSTSSIEDSSSSSSVYDDSVHNSLNELQTVPKNNIQRQLSLPVQWNRPKSVSSLSSTTQNDIHDSDRYLEEILIRNVKVWKRTQQIDNDSVFLEEDDLSTLHED